jgi:hypothetical protein
MVSPEILTSSRFGPDQNYDVLKGSGARFIPKAIALYRASQLSTTKFIKPKSRYRNAKNEVSPDCIMVCDQTDPHPMGETTRTYEDTTIPD